MKISPVILAANSIASPANGLRGGDAVARANAAKEMLVTMEMNAMRQLQTTIGEESDEVDPEKKSKDDEESKSTKSKKSEDDDVDINVDCCV